MGVCLTPRLAIVWATEAIWSGVAKTRPCPMALEPISSGDVISPALGRVLSLAPKIVGGSFQPKRSAVATRRSAPTLTPSGANTELQEWAKLSVKVPPHSSPLALESGTPSIRAELTTSNSSVGLTSLWSSAAVVVTSLKVEPGG